MTGPSKLSESLRKRLEDAAEGEMLDIVLELQPIPLPQQGSRAERIAESRAAFAREAEPVAAAIRSASGEVLGEVWTNQTMLARIAAGRVAPLAGLHQVVLLDLPAPLTLAGH
jgi:hypothetical protein